MTEKEDILGGLDESVRLGQERAALRSKATRLVLKLKRGEVCDENPAGFCQRLEEKHRHIIDEDPEVKAELELFKNSVRILVIASPRQLEAWRDEAKVELRELVDLWVEQHALDALRDGLWKIAEQLARIDSQSTEIELLALFFKKTSEADPDHWTADRVN